MWKTLAALDLTYKKGRSGRLSRIVQTSPSGAPSGVKKQPSLTPGKLVFIDDTWTKTNMTRLYGRAPRGKQLVDAVSHGHWKTSTFIGALRCDGLTATGVIDGAINGELFLARVEQVLVPTLRWGDVVRALRTVDALWKALGSLVDCFTPEECFNFLCHDGSFQSI
jgi:hypothetical protein